MRVAASASSRVSAAEVIANNTPSVVEPVNEKDTIAALISKAQQSLDLHPSSATPGPDGSDAVKKILGSVMSVATDEAASRPSDDLTAAHPQVL